MNYAKIKKIDIANGLGLRVSLFVSGRRNHCKGCFNPETWRFDYGKKFDKNIEKQIVELLKRPFIKGLSILGGDPFEPENVKALLPFIKTIKKLYPEKDIWCYTGYTYKEINHRKNGNTELLKYIDVLVDGKFVEELKDLNLRFCGSSNQRLLKLENGKVVSKNEFTQTITTSLKNAYLRLTAEECEWRCEDGAPKLSTIEYVFYTTDEFVSYLFKTSGLTNNYLSVNQSNFLGREKIDALKDICKNFFVSGEGILLDNYEDILFQEASNWLSGNQNTHYGRMANVPGQLAFDLKDSYNYTATHEDEKDMNIPVGTKYTLNVANRILYENFLLKGRYIEQSTVYKIGDDEYVDAVAVDNCYTTGTEIAVPNKDNYSLVDGIFDL